jgi:hypothetical protein
MTNARKRNRDRRKFEEHVEQQYILQGAIRVSATLSDKDEFIRIERLGKRPIERKLTPKGKELLREGRAMIWPGDEILEPEGA